MKILITGANGYIGSRLLAVLLNDGHEVYALVRHKTGLSIPIRHPKLQILEADFLSDKCPLNLPEDIDVAYYLIHAMSYGGDFSKKEKQIISNFLSHIKKTSVKQIIYLSGIANDDNLSPHLASRLNTERAIIESGLAYTILRASIIIGSGSASFEIIRDLVEKLPMMVAPKWVNKLSQPIALKDVLRYLRVVMLHPECLNEVFDIGGPDVLSYKEMLLGYAKVRHLKRRIFVVPVLTPRLSSYWLLIVTSVNFSLASALVESLKNNVICKNRKICEIFPEQCLNYESSLREALITQQEPLFKPSWKDAFVYAQLEARLDELKKIPIDSCFIDQQTCTSTKTKSEVIDKIWNIGGPTGWYMWNWSWKLRGWVDKLIGGVGLQRGRSVGNELYEGATLDFWRVLAADKKEGYLLLYAEMKIPGEAWLEFRVKNEEGKPVLIQTAYFKPEGIIGKLYWYLLFPFHFFIFRGMARQLSD